MLPVLRAVLLDWGQKGLTVCVRVSVCTCIRVVQAKVAAVTMDSLTAVTKHPLSAHTPTTVSQPATQPHPQGPPQGSNPAGLSHQPNQGLNQAGLSPQEVQALHQQISKRMGELYTYFKGVHDKDQAKLRCVEASCPCTCAQIHVCAYRSTAQGRCRYGSVCALACACACMFIHARVAQSMH